MFLTTENSVIAELEGISGYGYTEKVLKAYYVLDMVKELRVRDDLWDAEHRKEHYKEVITKIKSWGDAMVIVRSFGMVCGVFEITPLLISENQYYFLLDNKWI